MKNKKFENAHKTREELFGKLQHIQKCIGVVVCTYHCITGQRNASLVCCVVRYAISRACCFIKITGHCCTVIANTRGVTPVHRSFF
jgi:hypothetical protein